MWRNTTQLFDNAISTQSENYDFLKSIHSGIVKQNACPISQKPNVDVSGFQCQVRRNHVCHFSQKFFWLIVFVMCITTTNTGSEDTKICGPAKMRCCNHAENKIFEAGYFDACDCLPACTMVSYNVDAFETEFDLLSSWSRSKLQQTLDFEKY